MQQRIEQIKSLYKTVEAYQAKANAFPSDLGRLKSAISAELIEIDKTLDNSIVSAASDCDVQVLIDVLKRQSHLKLIMDTINNKESDIISSLGFKVRAEYREPTIQLRHWVNETIADDVDADVVNLLLSELGDYLKPSQVEWLKDVLPEDLQA